MNQSTKSLFFNYSSTAKIRIKKKNCFENSEFPCVYRIITKKLDFIIPRPAVILSREYVFIPLEIYRQKLTEYYSSIKS